MKKQLLFVAAGLLTLMGLSTQANALNPYAYGLKGAFNPMKETIDVEYSLNAAAQSGKLVFYDDTVTAKSIDLTPEQLSAGAKSLSIPVEGLPTGKLLKWTISVTGAEVAAPTEEVEKSQRFYHPQGVDVDNNFNSPYFGRVYVTECMTPPAATESDPYLSGKFPTDGKGLYVFDASLNPIRNSSDTYAFKGGIDYEETHDGATSYDPRKVRIAADGRVFMTRQAAFKTPLLEVNPANLNADFTEVFKGVVDSASYVTNTAAGDFVAGTNVSMDVKGAGDSLKVLLLSASKSGLAFTYSGYSTDEYNLGAAKTWETGPSKNIDWLTGQWTIQGNNTNVVYDNEGGIWYVQYRATPSDEQPAILHVNAAGEEDFRNISIVAGGAGVRFNKDFTLLAIANAKKQIGIYAVGNNEGKPTLDLKYEFPTTIGTNCNDIAWDIANNLYIVGNSGEWLKVFALPRTTTDAATTLAADNYAVTLPVPSLYQLSQTNKYTENLPAVADARQATFANGKLYIQDKASNHIEMWTKDGKSDKVIENTGEGTDITTDEAGNLIVFNGSFPNSFTAEGVTTASINVFPADGSAMKTIELTNLPSKMGRLDFFGKVRGNILSEDGGEMYLPINGGLNIVVIPIVSGEQDVINTANLALTQCVAADNGTVVYPYDESSVIYNRRGVGNSIIKVGIDAKMSGGYEVTEEGYTFTTPGHNACNGSDVFELDGVKYIVYPSQTNYRDGFSIALADSVSTNEAVVTYDETLSVNPNSTQTNWLYAAQTAPGKATIYQYVPGGYVATYEFTAPVPTAKAYLLGEVEGTDYTWAANLGVEMKETSEAGVFEATQHVGKSGLGHFGLTTKLGATADDWTTCNDNQLGGHEFGTDTNLKSGVAQPLVKGFGAFVVPAGEYSIKVDLNKMEMTATRLDAPKYSLVQLRKFSENLPAVADARQATFANGKLYIQDKASNHIEMWTKDGKSDKVIENTGEGTDITTDEAGNLIVFNGSFPNSFTAEGVTTASINVFPADGSAMKTIELTNLPSKMGRLDFFGKVRGNILSEDGGEMYLPINGGLNIVVIPIVSGEQDVINTANLALTQCVAADNGTVVYPYDESSVIYNRRGANNTIIKVGIDAKMSGGYEVTEEGYTFTTPGHNSCNGSSIFELDGVKYIVYPSQTNYFDGFSIALADSVSTNEALVVYDETVKANPNSFQANWLYAQPVSATRALIYQYVPGGYVAIYEFNTALNNYPDNYYVVGNLNNSTWDPSDAQNVLTPVPDTVGMYEGNVEVVANGSETNGYFGVSSVIGSNSSDWAAFNSGRVGPKADNEVITAGTEKSLIESQNAFMVVPGKYKFTIDKPFSTIMLTALSGVDVINPVENAKVIAGIGEINVIGAYKSIEVYTIGGALISNNKANIACEAGIYLVRVDGKVTKVVVR